MCVRGLLPGIHDTPWTGRDEIPPALRVLLRWVGVLLLAGVWVACGWGWSGFVGMVLLPVPRW